MTHIDVTPAYAGLLEYSLVILFRVLAGVDGTIVKPVRYGTTKGIEEASICVDLLEPGSKGVDIT